MSFRRSIGQLRPALKSKQNLVEKVQVIREASDKDVDFVMKSISGNIAEAVYEAWAYIVAKKSGAKTLPTIKDVQSSMSDSEFDSIGKKWIENSNSLWSSPSCIFESRFPSVTCSET